MNTPRGRLSNDRGFRQSTLQKAGLQAVQQPTYRSFAPRQRYSFDVRVPYSGNS